MLKKISSVKNKITRRLTTPFASLQNRPLIIHCCHHKVGTVWFRNILSGVAREYGLAFQKCSQQQLRPDTAVWLQDHSHVDLSQLPSYRGTHIIRDPRDMIVSGYFYHLRTKESWVHIPRTEYHNMSYQQYLASLSQEKGITAEIARSAKTVFRDMMSWDYDNPSFLEITYENLITHEKKMFAAIFNHYGFTDDAIEAAVHIAEKYSLKNMVRKASAGPDSPSHIRSGRPGEWKKYFTGEHKKYFKDLLGDMVVTLGYETDNNW